jgi:putative nucleotidyltransferase with HDIG domain
MKSEMARAIIVTFKGDGALMDSRTIFQRLNNIESLPTLPAIAMEVNALLCDRETSVQKLRITIEKDQAIVPKILKLVNSSFFGLHSKVGNLSHAIVLLGFNPIRNAILSISVIEAFSGQNSLKDFDITRFWEHSAAVAVISRYLAEKSGYRSLEDAFTAGLLHDVGKLIFFQYLPDLFKIAWESARKNGITLHQAEKRELPVTHTRVGAFLAKKWLIPQSLTDAIRYHHTISRNAANYPLLLIVHTADQIAKSDETSPGGKPDLSAIHPEAASRLAEPLSSLPAWHPEALKEIESACRLFLGR